jgi:site-specific DNA-methyltransferase (cytosine-N4-specific)
MPESVTDRPTKAHEYIFLLTKSSRYYYNAEAIFEPALEGTDLGILRGKNAGGPGADKIAWHANSIRARQDAGVDSRTANTRVLKSETSPRPVSARNKRTVWSIATQPYAGSHFATFPEEIPRLCILAGSRPGDVILDPFGGSGTTSKVALELGRKPVHIDLTYHELARKRMTTTPAMVGLMG